MSIEFIGIAATQKHSETEIEKVPDGPPVNADYLRAHEDAGFDRVLVTHSSASPDGFIVADQVLTGADSTALVGSYEQVAESLLDYLNLGVSTLLIRGFTPLTDATDYGNLIRVVREQVLTGAPA